MLLSDNYQWHHFLMTLYDMIGLTVVSAELKDHLQAIKTFCIEHEESIAVAESVTAGALQFLLSTTVGATEFFQGGVTVYNSAQKAKHLGIQPIVAEKYNGVSEKITVELAKNVCRSFCCEIGVGITGYATPIPEQNIDKLFAHVVIVRNGEIVIKEKLTTNVEGAAAQVEYAETTIKILANALNNKA